MPDTSVRIWSLSLTISSPVMLALRLPGWGLSRVSFAAHHGTLHAKAPLCSPLLLRRCFESIRACLRWWRRRPESWSFNGASRFRLLLHHPHLKFKLLLALLPGGFLLFDCGGIVG